MPLIKFLGELQEKYGFKKHTEELDLDKILTRFLTDDEKNHKYLQILINGNNIGKERNIKVKKDDTITIYILGGTGYPGG
ncbi:hypothetical protein OWM07_03330 [Deferribacter thermophilus]|uniref:hypothetical protein n=1 Tax=Deferribacter thermophilus TaxID=53573 RepID=UPI003C202C6F